MNKCRAVIHRYANDKVKAFHACRRWIPRQCQENVWKGRGISVGKSLFAVRIKGRLLVGNTKLVCQAPQISLPLYKTAFMQAPQVECDRHHPLLLVQDIPAAVDYYTQKLGFTLGFLWNNPPTMAGVNLGNVSVHLSKGAPGQGGSSVFFVVGNADELYAFQHSNGVTITEEPADRAYGLRDYTICDPYGNTLGFGHYIYHVGEPIPIERVDLPVRIEKRLAAVLYDLAAHKGMNINSTLEETLLHTFEMDDKGHGVSPHTPRTMRYIQELKKKHGIDYDSHGSYLFVE